MGFTFYGDLLGISGYYKLSFKIAKDKLDEFYNTVFFSLSDYCHQHADVHVHMFSDSMLFYGDDPIPALEQLQRVYVKLIYKGLLLRGAIVNGKLSFQIRTELSNFEKRLPDDSLARAVGLESTKKGARLLIEPQLAENMLAEHTEWLTHEGYINTQSHSTNIPNRNHYTNVRYESILRRISPTLEQDSYECLYFWTCHRDLGPDDIDYEVKIDDLNEIKGMLGENIANHYGETIALFERCNKRQNFTKKVLGM